MSHTLLLGGYVWPGITVEPVLGWLLDPLPTEVFFDEVLGVAHHHVERDRPGYFDRLVEAASAVDDLLECVRPAPSAVRLVKGDDIKDAGNYLLDDGGLDLAGVHNDFGDGYTIVLDNLEQYARAITSLSHALEVELDFPAQVNGYISPPHSAGFTPHYDHHDVFVLQIRGAKTWHLFNDAPVSPRDMQRRDKVVAADLPPPTALRLNAGDVLYLPRGRIHAAETGSEPSIHLTVGIHTPTVLTLLTHVLHLLSFQDDRIHTRLPPGHLTDPGIRSSLGAVVGDVVKTVEEPDVIAAGLAAMEDLLVRRGRCPPVGQASNVMGLDGRTLVVKHQPLYSRVIPVGDRVGLQFAQLLISVDTDHAAALRFVSSSVEPFRVGDLPGLDQAQQVQLTRTLLTSGFLVRFCEPQLRSQY